MWLSGGYVPYSNIGRNPQRRLDLEQTWESHQFPGTPKNTGQSSISRHSVAKHWPPLALGPIVLRFLNMIPFQSRDQRSNLSPVTHDTAKRPSRAFTGKAYPLGPKNDQDHWQSRKTGIGRQGFGPISRDFHDREFLMTERYSSTSQDDWTIYVSSIGISWANSI